MTSAAVTCEGQGKITKSRCCYKKMSDISMSNVQEKLMAMSTIWYHDFCKIWIKNWLKIGMMIFLKQKVKVMNFFIDTDGKINL